MPVHIRGKSSDSWVLNSILICREYDGLVQLTPKTVIDGGANIGLASLFWHRLYPEAEIVAVEPDEENYRLATQNLANLSNVSVIHGGLWSKTTKLRIINNACEKYAVRVAEDSGGGGVDAYSISSIMQEQGWDRIDVLKLDVEGAEVELLSKNVDEWIDRVNVMIIELHRDFAPEGAEILFRAFANRKFDLKWRGENLILTRRPVLSDECNCPANHTS